MSGPALTGYPDSSMKDGRRSARVWACAMATERRASGWAVARAAVMTARWSRKRMRSRKDGGAPVARLDGLLVDRVPSKLLLVSLFVWRDLCTARIAARRTAPWKLDSTSAIAALAAGVSRSPGTRPKGTTDS